MQPQLHHRRLHQRVEVVHHLRLFQRDGDLFQRARAHLVLVRPHRVGQRLVPRRHRLQLLDQLCRVLERVVQSLPAVRRHRMRGVAGDRHHPGQRRFRPARRRRPYAAAVRREGDVVWDFPGSGPPGLRPVFGARLEKRRAGHLVREIFRARRPRPRHEQLVLPGLRRAGRWHILDCEQEHRVEVGMVAVLQDRVPHPEKPRGFCAVRAGEIEHVDVRGNGLCGVFSDQLLSNGGFGTVTTDHEIPRDRTAVFKTCSYTAAVGTSRDSGDSLAILYDTLEFRRDWFSSEGYKH